MTSLDLARSYIKKALVRLDILDVLHEKGAYSDAMREAQELVELALKGLLRFVGIEPPKYPDVGHLLLEHSERFPDISREELQKAAEVSKVLRKEREFSFYGDIDFIPTEEYTEKDSKKAMQGARFVVDMVKKLTSGQL